MIILNIVLDPDFSFNRLSCAYSHVFKFFIRIFNAYAIFSYHMGIIKVKGKNVCVPIISLVLYIVYLTEYVKQI